MAAITPAGMTDAGPAVTFVMVAIVVAWGAAARPFAGAVRRELWCGMLKTHTQRYRQPT